MKINKTKNEELETLWKLRDNAVNDKARKKTQEEIDEYFLGKPEKKVKKKREKKKFYPDEEGFTDF